MMRPAADGPHELIELGKDRLYCVACWDVWIRTARAIAEMGSCPGPTRRYATHRDRGITDCDCMDCQADDAEDLAIYRYDVGRDLGLHDACRAR
jgi:hypothetical protein